MFILHSRNIIIIIKMKSYLLPNYFQRIGWIIFITGFLVFFAGLFAFNNLRIIPQAYSRYLTLIIYLFIYLSVLFLGLSKEKIEDELTMSTRINSLAITAYISFIVFLVFEFAFSIAIAFRFLTTDSYRILGIIKKILINPYSLFLIYIIIFRIKIIKYNKGIKDEE